MVKGPVTQVPITRTKTRIMKMQALDWLNCSLQNTPMLIQTIEGMHFCLCRFRCHYRSLCDLAIQKSWATFHWTHFNLYKLIWWQIYVHTKHRQAIFQILPFMRWEAVGLIYKRWALPAKRETLKLFYCIFCGGRSSTVMYLLSFLLQKQNKMQCKVQKHLQKLPICPHF